MSLAFGRHRCHLNGVGGESGQTRHLVLLSEVGQIVGHPRVGAVELLPGDPVAWRGGGAAQIPRGQKETCLKVQVYAKMDINDVTKLPSHYFFRKCVQSMLA